MPEDQHVVHEWATTEPSVRVQMESHGAYGTGRFYRTWEVRATAGTVPDALALIRAADAALRAEFTAAEVE